MNTPFILDACSLIAFLNAERGGERVKILFEDTGNRIYVHMVNLCEVYYGFYKMDGEEQADAVLENLNILPIEYRDDLSIDFLKIVGKYKANYRISLANVFVLGLAEEAKGRVVTTDHKEFDPVEKEGVIRFHWLRQHN